MLAEATQRTGDDKEIVCEKIQQANFGWVPGVREGRMYHVAARPPTLLPSLRLSPRTPFPTIGDMPDNGVGVS